VNGVIDSRGQKRVKPCPCLRWVGEPARLTAINVEHVNLSPNRKPICAAYGKVFDTFGGLSNGEAETGAMSSWVFLSKCPHSLVAGCRSGIY
jgi:hypothetical protein